MLLQMDTWLRPTARAVQDAGKHNRSCDMAWLFGLTALASITCAFLLHARSVEIIPQGLDWAILAAILASPAAYVRFRHADALLLRHIVEFAFAAGLLAFVSLAIAIASYAAVREGGHFVDAPFAEFGRALGFDWLQLYRFEASHAGVRFVLRAAYGMIKFTPFLVVAALVLEGHYQRLERFIKAYAIAGIVTVVLFHFSPVQSPVVYFLGTNPPYLPCTGIEQASVVASLQTGVPQTLALGSLIGIVGFPSFHATVSVLFSWAIWPHRVYRWPLVGINALMLVATPMEGAHYLADVLAGIAVAGMALAFAGLPLKVDASKWMAWMPVRRAARTG